MALVLPFFVRVGLLVDFPPVAVAPGISISSVVFTAMSLIVRCPFDQLSEHDIANVFRHVAVDLFDAADARAFRGVSARAVRGYDCAVHADWVPVSGHRTNAPAEKGATCRWVSGWFPMALRTPCHPVLQGVVGTHGVTMRVEHLPVALAAEAGPWPHLFFPCGGVIFCQTLRRSLCIEASVGWGVGLQEPAWPPPASSAAITVAALPSQLLAGHTSLKSLHCLDLTGVTRVCDYVLDGCESLETLDVSGLRSATSIGDGFASRCTSLRTVDVARLGAVRTIGASFMRGCSLLAAFDTAGLSAVTSLGDRFLCDCPSLTAVDVSGLTSVTSVGYDFLSGARSLRTFDPGPLGTVPVVRDGLLRESPAESEDAVVAWAEEHGIGPVHRKADWCKNCAIAWGSIIGILLCPIFAAGVYFFVVMLLYPFVLSLCPVLRFPSCTLCPCFFVGLTFDLRCSAC